MPKNHWTEVETAPTILLCDIEVKAVFWTLERVKLVDSVSIPEELTNATVKG